MNKFLQRFETYLTKKPTLKESLPILLVFSSIFISLTCLLIYFKSSNLIGIFAQFQVLTSILLTIHLPGSGYVMSILLNIFLGLVFVVAFGVNHLTISLPGIFIPLFAILLISILRFLLRNLINKIRSLSEQNDQLQQLNTDLDHAHKALKQQNEVLESYHQIIRENENRLSRLAYFDLLTNLPNRTLLSDRMELLISFSREYSTQFYTIFIDLNQFHRINDMVGITGGDFCLKSLARRLQTAVNPDDLVARLGSDKFVIMIKRNVPSHEVKTYLHQLSNMIIQPIDFEDQIINIRPSFGVAVYPLDGSSVPQILALADSEVYKGLSDPDNNVTFFSPGLSL
ncbi:diguanylate cyclase [Eubacteriaceae bacterium ES2]|nr:diguanylate cyclase [Eubacteriaceae bacterium ES2]